MNLYIFFSNLTNTNFQSLACPIKLLKGRQNNFRISGINPWPCFVTELTYLSNTHPLSLTWKHLCRQTDWKYIKKSNKS